MNGRLVMYKDRIWRVVEPRGGGVCLRRGGAVVWISTVELDRLESGGLEGLREKDGRLVRA